MHDGLVGLGRRDHDRAVGAVACLRRPARCSSECWPAMVAWVDFAARAARDGRHPSRAGPLGGAGAARAVPLGHRVPLGRVARARRPRGRLHGPRTRARSAPRSSTARRCLAAHGRRLLGQDAEAERSSGSRPTCLDAWRTEFIAADGSLTHDTQANHVRALAFGLVPDDLRARTADRLVELIRAAGHPPRHRVPRHAVPAAGARRHRPPRRRLRAAPPGHAAVVAAHGRAGRHHRLGGLGGHRRGRHRGRFAQPLQQGRGHLLPAHRTSPASSSSTTVPATGGSASHRDPGGGLTWAEAVHDSPYGRIESSWRLDGDVLHLTTTVPSGSSAEVVLPDGSHHDQGPGTASWDCKVT